MQVEGKIVEIFVSHTECLNENITVNTKIETLGLTSLLFVQIIVAIEEACGIEFAIDDLRIERFIFIRDCVDRVKELIGEK